MSVNNLGRKTAGAGLNPLIVGVSECHSCLTSGIFSSHHGGQFSDRAGKPWNRMCLRPPMMERQQEARVPLLDLVSETRRTFASMFVGK
ncbi:hypothetical protein J6590_066782 [Homalodisca vitripennis]|nr:hypothetical protein J6590_066782 [Homalodisca vitripennis]